MTERLYYQDPCLVSWEASIVERLTVEGRPAVVLDRTAFYPGGGGQPDDRGTIGDARVLSSVEDGDRIVHVVDREVALGPAHCELDWARRHDMMQQHTAQHILSEAFIRLLGAHTVAFHLSEESATIDLPIAPPAGEHVAAVEALANQSVTSAAPVQVWWFPPGQAVPLALRKQPDVAGDVRIVSVGEFDHSPCGGVHCLNSADLGLIKVLRVERRGREARVYFAAGSRALADYGAKAEIVSALARQLTIGEADLVAAVGRLADEARATRKELEAARASLLDLEAERMLAGAERLGAVRLVAAVLPGVDAERVKQLGRRIVETGGSVALLAAVHDKVQLVFARSEDVSADMGQLLRQVAPIVSGSGGGRPNLAQGGGTDVARADEAIAAAADRVRSWAKDNT